ncbi:MAG: class I SAM-dependent methyltransferase family protein [Halobacteriaceae archaeon]
MTQACVRVPREAGEATRQQLVDAGLLDHDREIVHEESHLFIPITDRDGVPDELEVVERPLPAREGQTMPADLLGWDPSYERVGDLIVVDEDDPERAAAIATAVMDSDLPANTVLNRASKIRGEQRVRDWTVLAGDGTETIHREYGHEYRLDLRQVYFSPRLATERHRVVDQVSAGEQLLDMFAGVGPFVIPSAARGATCVGVDLNADAIRFLEENAERNGVADRVTAVEGDVRTATAQWTNWADRLVMNLPHSADEFLPTAIRLAGERCVLHYYDIQHEGDPYGPGMSAIWAAAEPDYTVTVRDRRTVRSYAPHELNVCLDVVLERA